MRQVLLGIDDVSLPSRDNVCPRAELAGRTVRIHVTMGRLHRESPRLYAIYVE